MDDKAILSIVNGNYRKKINGKAYYFGRVPDGLNNALAKYYRELPFIENGKPIPKILTDDCQTPTIGEAVTLYLKKQKAKADRGDIRIDYYRNLVLVGKIFVETIPEHVTVGNLDNDIYKELGERFRFGASGEKEVAPITAKVQYSRFRMFLFFFESEGWINKVPRDLYEIMEPPTKRDVRLSKKPKVITKEQILQILATCVRVGNHNVKAMMLLCLNTGAQNIDCATLLIGDIDWGEGIWQQKRRKTGGDRKMVLWSRTVDALREQVRENYEENPETLPGEYAVFLNRYKKPYSIDQHKTIGGAFKRVVEKTRGLEMPSGFGLQWLRHFFATAGNSIDREATQISMGHVHNAATIDEFYVHSYSTKRLRKLAKKLEKNLFEEISTLKESF